MTYTTTYVPSRPPLPPTPTLSIFVHRELLRHRRHRIGTVGTVDPGHRVTPGSCGIPSPVIHPLAFPDVALARSPNNRAKYSPASSLAYA